jgi:hypothetical protein
MLKLNNSKNLNNIFGLKEIKIDQHNTNNIFKNKGIKIDPLKFSQRINFDSDEEVIVGVNEFAIGKSEKLTTSNINSCFGIVLINEKEYLLAHVSPLLDLSQVSKVIDSYLTEATRILIIYSPHCASDHSQILFLYPTIASEIKCDGNNVAVSISNDKIIITSDLGIENDINMSEKSKLR